MTQGNVDVVQELLEAFARRDHERAFAFYDADILWEHLDDNDLGGVYHGHEGVRAYWREWLSAWSDLRFEVQGVLEAGDEVVALIHNQRQWGRHSGIEVEWPPYGLVFTLRDNKVVRWRFFPDQRLALEAVGLHENVDVVRRVWDAFLEGDLPTALALTDPNIEWDGTNLPDGQVGRGREAVMDHVRRWADQWSEWTVEVERIIDAGDDRVVVLMRERGRSKSGLGMDERHAELYDLRDRLVVRRQGFSDPREALEAVGLSG